jgi:hypothetical protein
MEFLFTPLVVLPPLHFSLSLSFQIPIFFSLTLLILDFFVLCPASNPHFPITSISHFDIFPSTRDSHLYIPKYYILMTTNTLLCRSKFQYAFSYFEFLLTMRTFLRKFWVCRILKVRFFMASITAYIYIYGKLWRN